MDRREQDSQNTPSRQFHPWQFAIISVIVVLILTAIISFIANPRPIQFYLFAPKHIPLSVVKKSPWETLKVRNHDNLQAVFHRAQLSNQDYYELIPLPAVKETLKPLHPGQAIYILKNKSGQLEKLVCVIDHKQYLEVIRKKNKLEATVVTLQLTQREVIVKGTIHQSFSKAAANAGLSDATALKLTDIFDWDINFAHSIQEGDQFKVIYNAYYHHDKLVKTGDILAASFTNKNKTYIAIRYELTKGQDSYYSSSGKNLKHTFLRAPIHYKYISSPFNSKRMHPILHIIRPHEGVDLAAASGTPIHAAGKGEIIFRGRRGGYGKCIAIRHNREYTTLYAHMSRFASNYHVGSHVNEGSIIGYVGETGLATGPHLHYEFHIYGIPHDPMKVKLPNAQPIPHKDMPAFQQYANQMIQRLNEI